MQKNLGRPVQFVFADVHGSGDVDGLSLQVVAGRRKRHPGDFVGGGGISRCHASRKSFASYSRG